MFDCDRNSADPVLKAFVEEHSLNLLRWPRHGVQVGDLIISRDRRTFSPVRIEEIFISELPLNLPQKRVELAPFDTSFSSNLEISTVVSFIDGLISRLGGKASGKLKSAYATAKHAKVKIKGGRKALVKLSAIAQWLGSATVSPHQRLMKEGDKLYLVTAVVTSNELEVSATDADNNGIDINLSAIDVADASGAISANKSAGASVVYKAKMRLTIGVELNELVPDGNTWRLDLPSGWVDVRGGQGGEPSSPNPVFLHGNKSSGKAFINFADD